MHSPRCFPLTGVVDTVVVPAREGIIFFDASVSGFFYAPTGLVVPRGGAFYVMADGDSVLFLTNLGYPNLDIRIEVAGNRLRRFVVADRVDQVRITTGGQAQLFIEDLAILRRDQD